MLEKGGILPEGWRKDRGEKGKVDNEKSTAVEAGQMSCKDCGYTLVQPEGK